MISNFVLRHSDISTTANQQTASSNYGSWSDWKTISRWTVDLREIIGPDTYDSHSRFKLQLNGISYGYQVGFPGTDPTLGNTYPNQQVQLSIRANGIDLIGSTYQQSTQRLTTRWLATSYFILTQNAQSFYFPNNIASTLFNKGSTQVTFEIELLRCVDNTRVVGSGTNAYPSHIYSFSIVPIS